MTHSTMLNDFVARATGKRGDNRTAKVKADKTDYEPTATLSPDAIAYKEAKERIALKHALMFYRQAYFKTKHLEARRQYEADTADAAYEWKPPRPVRPSRTR